jgi:hypothetical protein
MVRIHVENEVEEPRAETFVIDAKTGELLERWDDLHTAKPGGGPTPGSGSPAVGTAKTLYLGQLSPNTEFCSRANTYGMVDRTPGNAYTTDMKNRQSGSGDLFLDGDNVWGDFTDADRATAGTDAHLGMAFTWYYYKDVHGRNGIYNDGVGAFSRVHYGRNYKNAFWSGSCKRMTYGDGDGSVLSPLVSLDVAGHEMSHGVTWVTANLQYSPGNSVASTRPPRTSSAPRWRFTPKTPAIRRTGGSARPCTPPARAVTPCAIWTIPRRTARALTTTPCTTKGSTCTAPRRSPITSSTCWPMAVPTRLQGSP